VPPEAIEAKEVESGALPEEGDAETETDSGVVVDEVVVDVVVVGALPDAYIATSDIEVPNGGTERDEGSESPHENSYPVKLDDELVS